MRVGHNTSRKKDPGRNSHGLMCVKNYKINFSKGNTKYSFCADPPIAFKKILKEKYLKIF